MCQRATIKIQKGDTNMATKETSVRIPEELLAKAKEQAKVEGRTLSNLIIQALRKYLGSL